MTSRTRYTAAQTNKKLGRIEPEAADGEVRSLSGKRYVVLTGLVLGGGRDVRFCSTESGSNAWLSSGQEHASEEHAEKSRCRACKAKHDVVTVGDATRLGLLKRGEAVLALNIEDLLGCQS